MNIDITRRHTYDTFERISEENIFLIQERDYFIN